MSMSPGQMKSLWSSLPTLFTILHMRVLPGALQTRGKRGDCIMQTASAPHSQPQALPSVPAWQGDTRHSTGGISHLLKQVTKGL